MDSKIKKLAAAVALAGAFTVGAVGAADTAFAADSSGTGTSTQAANGHPRLQAEFRRGAVKVAADTLGVSRQDLRTALKGGQTISEYATSQGKDPQTVVDALTTAANTKLDQLVAAGRFSSDQAASIKSNLSGRIDTLMNHHFGQHASA
jgi:hypothetical protein